MVSKVILILSQWLAPGPVNLTPAVAAEAAYVLATYTPASQCCGQCKNGIVTHGDGHATACPCPADCKCKAKTVTHPPAILHPCPSGKCNLKQSK